VITVSPLEKADLAAADRVFRLAFGTAIGLPDPLRFAEGAELVRPRWHADPDAAFKAHADGELVGVAFVARWGSFAVFGPLAVRPDYWDKGVGRRLWEARLPLLERWGTTAAGLFTRPEPKNLYLYQQFGFWPRFLTALTAKPLERPAQGEAGWGTFSALGAGERDACLDECRALTDAIYPGLDLEREIRIVVGQGIGETILLGGAEGLDGFAVCHLGEGSEAGPGTCYVKFAAARTCAGAERRFGRLLDACEELAVARGLARIAASVNTARHEAYRALIARGHRTLVHGVAMHRRNEPGFNRPGVYVLDDWR
jgi:GNAT superfamily N-acetyltransferase